MKKKTDKEKEKKSPKSNKKNKKTIRKKGDSRKKNKLNKRSKKYSQTAMAIDKGREYSVEEAVHIIKKGAATKFDSSVEIHLNLGIDPKNPDHQIRGNVSLPSGIGKEKKVAVVCEEKKENEAKKFGADITGGPDFIKKIIEGKNIDFDVLVATPSLMGDLSKAGRILGPKGLMPNPKDGTVTDNLKDTISEIKKGRTEYRTDPYGIVHSVVGKSSFEKSKLIENIECFLKEINNIRPASIKSDYIKSIYLTTTMGPSIKITKNSIQT